MFCFKLYLSKLFFVNLFVEKTAKKGITVLPKSAAKPDIKRYYLRNSADMCSRRRRPCFLQIEIARGHYTANIISYFYTKVKVFFDKMFVFICFSLISLTFHLIYDKIRVV